MRSRARASRNILAPLGGGLSNTVRLIATGDLTLPLEEIGVPANLKVGAGAAVAVTAQEGAYAVKLSGDATIFLNETFGGDTHAEVGVTGAAPQVAGSLAAAWHALTTGSTSPAAGGSAQQAGGALVPAGAGGSSAATDSTGAAAGGGRQVEVNAGIRGSSETEWLFQATKARTSCEGIGGLVTLLAGLGVAQALPAPFNSLGAAAVQSGFMDQMQSSRFSVGLAGEVKADLTTEGVGKLRGRLGGDVSENVQIVRDHVTGQLVTERGRAPSPGNSMRPRLVRSSPVVWSGSVSIWRARGSFGCPWPTKATTLFRPVWAARSRQPSGPATSTRRWLPVCSHRRWRTRCGNCWPAPSPAWKGRAKLRCR